MVNEDIMLIFLKMPSFDQNLGFFYFKNAKFFKISQTDIEAFRGVIFPKKAFLTKL